MQTVRVTVNDSTEVSNTTFNTDNKASALIVQLHSCHVRTLQLITAV